MKVSLNAKYVVVKQDDIDRFLTFGQRSAFNDLLRQTQRERKAVGKSEHTYLVVNTDEPYAAEVAAILHRRGPGEGPPPNRWCGPGTTPPPVI